MFHWSRWLRWKNVDHNKGVYKITQLKHCVVKIVQCFNFLSGVCFVCGDKMMMINFKGSLSELLPLKNW